jgi:apolipoprotein N-acyltransferase
MTRRRVAALRWIVAALAGAACVPGFAPFRVAPLPVVALAVLFALWSGYLLRDDERAAAAPPGPRATAATGFAFGLGYFLTGTSWVYVSLHTFGGMPAALTAVSTFAFCAVVACYPALAGWLAAHVSARATGARHAGALRLLLVLPACWTVGELLRGYLFTGFPWLGLGYSQAPGSPLAGFAPVLGSYGVTWLAATLAGALALATCQAIARDVRGLVLPVVVGLAVIAAGAALRTIEWTAPAGAPVTVALLQGNVAQARKFDAEVLPSIFRQYREMVERADARLVVLPETAFPVFLHQVEPDYLDALTKKAIERDGDVLFGVAIADPQARAYFNAVVSTGASPPQAYRKSHLVPFGEYLPWRPVFEWVLDVLQIPMADFTPGRIDPPTIDVAGQRLALSICYEDAFGVEMRRQLPQATMLVNVSNDAWFGDSLAAEQHFQLAQMRALESGRMMLRANNTGVTAIIGADGTTVGRLPGFVNATLSGVAQGRSGATPYVRIGDWGIAAIVLGILLAIFVFGAPRRDSAIQHSTTMKEPT